MIEEYIEKDIMRRVKLVEFLFEMRELSIKDTAKRLNVTPNTIKRDFDKILVYFDDWILYSNSTSQTITAVFLSDLTRYTLVIKIYAESKFLNVCLRYLAGDTDYLSIVENEFVSVAKAFQIKKSVEDFFKHAKIMNENNHFIHDELRYRSVVLSILMRVDSKELWSKTELWQTAEHFVDELLERFSNNIKINKREYIFLVVNVYLSLTRSTDHSLKYPEDELQLIRQSVIFKELKKTIVHFFPSEVERLFSDDEIGYLTAAYRLISLNTPNYLIVKMDHDYERHTIIEHSPEIRALIRDFEKYFSVNLVNNILFEKPFINLVLSTWQNIQSFLVEQHYYLNDEQLTLILSIRKILEEWQKQYIHSDLDFTDTIIDKFTSQISTVLLQKNQQKQIFFVVAEDEFSHILYREHLEKWINHSDKFIDDRMYYAMEELPIYAKSWSHVILCERALLADYEISLDSTIFPVSRSTLSSDLRNILLYAYDNS
ncbi:helix-turn-helix domain-containing protein [Enterococcus crotali]|uniref:helix-turn-helix domain-containing protein n=1 Tax=Enterococcus crotali TaxID=1453587 RepID=UPI00046F8437|nr:helix-turn-helix domain-containing protein [Enterococcus crotali]